jgi:hypothetical protein
MTGSHRFLSAAPVGRELDFQLKLVVDRDPALADLADLADRWLERSPALVDGTDPQLDEPVPEPLVQPERGEVVVRGRRDGLPVPDCDQAAVAELVHQLTATCLHAAAELGVEKGRRPGDIRSRIERANRQPGKCQSPMP